MLNITTDPSLSNDGMENYTIWKNYTTDIYVTDGDITTEGPIRDEDGNVICAGPSEEEYMFYVTFAWWLEGFGQLLVGSLGKRI